MHHPSVPFAPEPGISAMDLLKEALAHFGFERIILASSFSIEDQALTHMLFSLEPKARLFTLDTGRLFQETYDTQQETQEKYGVQYEVLAPEASALSAFVRSYGPNAFYKSRQLRQECCAIRKTGPLKKVLSTVDAWICGLRQEQSPTRVDIGPVERDSVHSIYKLNPLWNWSEDKVWDYVRHHQVPFNPLQQKGFRSLGCAPCTRAVGAGEDIRAGRWWWESPEHRECGLHQHAKKANGAHHDRT